jgi:hypothetical protein
MKFENIKLIDSYLAGWQFLERVAGWGGRDGGGVLPTELELLQIGLTVQCIRKLRLLKIGLIVELIGPCPQENTLELPFKKFAI